MESIIVCALTCTAYRRTVMVCKNNELAGIRLPKTAFPLNFFTVDRITKALPQDSSVRY